MRRRTFLLCAGSITVVAGCTGEEDGDEPPSVDEEGREDESDDTNDTSDVEPEGELGAEDVDSEVFLADSSPEGNGDEVPWLRADVENASDVPRRNVRIETRFRDGDELVGTREQFTAFLPAETTWRYYSRHEFEMGDRMETEHGIVHQEAGVGGTLVEEFELVDGVMDFDGSVVSVTGEIDPGETEVDDLVIVPLIYDEEDRFVGAFRIHEDPGGETIAFTGGSVGFRTPVDRSQPDRFELIVIEPST